MSSYDEEKRPKKIGLKELQISNRLNTEDGADQIIERAFTQAKSTNYGELMNFLSNNPTFVRNRGSPEVHFYALEGGWYNLPTPTDQSIAMSLYEKCRIEQCTLSMAERQDPMHSAIYVDFDMLQATPSRVWTEVDLDRISIIAVEILSTMFELTNEFGRRPVHIGFQIKPAVVSKNDPKYAKYMTETRRTIYGDGIHMFILSILISRPAKKYFMQQYKERIAQYFGTRYLNSTAIIDMNSAHVPVFLLGGNRGGKPPYVHCSIWEVHLPDVPGGNFVSRKNLKIFKQAARNNQQTIDRHGMESDADDDILAVATHAPISYGEICIAHEYSVNYCRPSEHYGVIRKINMEVKPSMISKIAKYDTHFNLTDAVADDSGESSEHKMHGDLDSLTTKDHQALFIKQLLDILHPARADKYELWIRVIWAIANTSDKYKCLAEYFSRKCKVQFNADKFESDWASAVEKSRQQTHLKYKKSSICWWAKQDNPEQYNILLRKDIENIITRLAFTKDKMGKFGQFDIAELLEILLGDRYAIDVEEGGGRQLVLYEFVVPEDGMACKAGEPYKWRIARDSSFLQVYISKVLGNYMKNVHALMTQKTQKDDGGEETSKQTKGKVKWYISVLNNMRTTIEKLVTDSFKNGCISQFKHLIHTKTSGFATMLNKDPYLLGVGNGIVLLKQDGSHTFIKGIHPHRISQYTPIDYIEYDPTHPLVQKLLRNVREIFPDHEPDTHEWFMCMCASALDGVVKDPYFIIGFGDGANAKSYVSGLQFNTLGQTYAITLPVGSLTSKSTGGQANPDLYMLITARWTVFSESDAMQKINTALVKHLTGQEHIALRGLFKDMINIKPKCVYFMLSNHLVELSDTTYGAFRRIKIIPFRMTFCIDKEDFDPNNPYHRIADKELIRDFNSRPDVCARWLSILMYYRERFYKKYNGTLADVPHPHIIIATNEYRSTQDKVNVFVNARGVICSKSKRQSIMEAMEIYIAWYVSCVDANIDLPKLKNGLSQKFMGSVVSKYIKKDSAGAFTFEGFRFLKAEEKPSKGDVLYSSRNTIQLSEDVPDHVKIPVVADEDVSASDDEDASSSDDSDDSDTSVKSKHKRKSKRKEKFTKIKMPSANMSHEDSKGAVDVPDVLVAAALSSSQSTTPIHSARKHEYDKPFDKAKEGLKFKHDIHKAESTVNQIKPETVDQYYERMVREWRESQETKVSKEELNEEIADLIKYEQDTIRKQTQDDYEARVAHMTANMFTNASIQSLGLGHKQMRPHGILEADGSIKLDLEYMAAGLNDISNRDNDGSDSSEYEEEDDYKQKKSKSKSKRSSHKKHSKKSKKGKSKDKSKSKNKNDESSDDDDDDDGEDSSDE